MAAPVAQPPSLRRFRRKLFLAMMVVVVVLTSLGILIAQRRAAEDARADLQRDFELELASLHRLQDLRNSAVVDRSLSLAKNARIHAALEDNALDLLYPSAQEELRDLMEETEPGRVDSAEALHARFYRFLDSHGAVIVPPDNAAGRLSPRDEARLAQNRVPTSLQTGYLGRIDEARRRPTVDEMIAVPIRSTETGEVIAALVLGFKPVQAIPHGESIGMENGILVEGQLHMDAFEGPAAAQIVARISPVLTANGEKEQSLPITLEGRPNLLFAKLLNSHSGYPAAHEICVYPLDRLEARQARLRWQILLAGALLLLGGFVVSHFISRRLSRPVEELAVVSEENLAQRVRAEAELETTAEELERSARFSADASHQLKSPITVLRAGLDSLLAREDFPADVYEEISSLIHQTYRLTGVVEDLLLLSRMDEGKLRLSLKTVDLAVLVEEWKEDLQALPETADLRVEVDIPADLPIAGEIKYTSLVVHNLLDNARKYNRLGGTIRVVAGRRGEEVELRVANTGRGIPAPEQAFIFERFHRAAGGENVPGHGIGLNLARELARLHGGELSLVRSDGEWTEFSALFRAAAPAPQPAGITA